MKKPIIIHSEEDYERAQERVRALSAGGGVAGNDDELHALAEAMLAWELRLESAEEES